MTKSENGEAFGDGDCGLALVELLVALALLALMSTLLVTSFGTGRLTLQSFERRVNSPIVQSAQDLLSELFSGVRDTRRSEEGTKQGVPPLVGSADRVEFVSVVEKRGHFSGLYRVSVGAHRQAASSPARILTVELAIHRRVDGASGAKEQPMSRFHLLADLESLRFEYFGKVDQEEKARWHSTWEDRQRLPQLISVKWMVLSGTTTRRSRTFLFDLPTASLE